MPLRKIATGFSLALVLFLFCVGVLFLAAGRVDKSRLDTKLRTAVSSADIQRPGGWKSDDFRFGYDTNSDCLVLQSALYNPYATAQDLFSFYWRQTTTRHHTCDILTNDYVNIPWPDLAAHTEKSSSFWWGSATLSRLVLGLTPTSLATYRKILWHGSLLSSLFLVLSFGYFYRLKALILLPVFFALFCGFSPLGFWPSIAHAPGLILGLIFLALSAPRKDESVHWLHRSFIISLLGMASAYFDLMNGNLLLILFMMCCQLTMRYMPTLKKGTFGEKLEETQQATRLLVRDIEMNSLFFLAGVLSASAIHLIGYALANGSSLWLEFNLLFASFTRPFTNETAFLALSNNPLVLLYSNLAYQIDLPFRGILKAPLSLLFFRCGFVAWAIAIGGIWFCHRRRIINGHLFIGLGLAALSVPLWYALFTWHTITHGWMTVRLISLFCGGGLSMLLLLISAFVVSGPSEDTTRDLWIQKKQ